MMKITKRLISLLLVMAMLFCFAGCVTETPQTQTTVTSTNATVESSTEPSTEDTTAPAAEEYTEPLMDGYNQITFYWTYPGTYENCDIWIWWGDVAGKG